ncbi:transposase [Planctomicrobium sp. SH527]|uniref:transposase n=1 Tax=Planctomicrobium sp. SH527 TaxID=3448123 RepID=UPI003F5B4598
MARRPVTAAYSQTIPEAIESLIPSRVFVDFAVHGNTWWTPERLLLASALMSWREENLLTSRFEAVRELLASMLNSRFIPASYTGYAEALARWMPRMLSPLITHLQGEVQRLAGERWKTSDGVVFAADGSRFEAPRTEENELELKRAGKVKTAPQVFQTALLHLGTNALWDFRLGPGTASERRHLEEMSRDLPPRSLVVADAGLIGYELCVRLMNSGVSFLLRVGGNITLLAERWGTRMFREGQIVWLWPSHLRTHPPLPLRLIALKKRNRTIYLVTNVLEPERLTRKQAGCFYQQRWKIEVLFRSLKQTCERSRWRSRVPRTVLAEQISTMLGFWIQQLLSYRELVKSKVDLQLWSPAHARTRTRRILRRVLHSPFKVTSWLQELGLAIRDCYVRHRSKHSRSWPRQKHDPPTSPPRLRTLTEQLRNKGGQQLTTENTG